ncbi:MAG: chromophore lyase CpcT/CpeT [Gammaproteobacteria bacterium]
MRTAILGIGLLLGSAAAIPAPPTSPPAADKALSLVRQWVSGRYDNAIQATQDLANPAVPDDQKHRLMHQLFVPVTVDVPGIPGYLVYQQSSVDGSDDPAAITRVGLLQFFVDDTGQLRQRELNFRDPESFKNAHLEPDRLRVLTLEAFRFDSGCDFLLSPATGETEISGPMVPGACRFFSKGLNKELMADDAVTIRASEYWFLGRFVDETGRVMWGNASKEPVKLVRVPVPAEKPGHGH